MTCRVQWDVSVKLKSEPVLLEGGYEDWLLTYPTITTNANVSRHGNQQPQTSLTSRLYYAAVCV